MAWWAAAATGAGAVLGGMSASKASRTAQKVAGYNADLVRQEGAEESRRLKREIDKTEGLTNALSAASGVTMSGSRELFIEDVKKENQAQLSWLHKSTQQKKKIALAGGQAQAGQFKAQATAHSINAIAKAGQSLWGSGGLLSGEG